MLKLLKPFSFKRKIAQTPGTLVHVGEKKTDQVTATLIRCHGDDYQEELVDIPFSTDIQPPPAGNGIYWLNICGLHDVSLVRETGNRFQIHPLLQEDILDTLQRPKLENYDDYHFAVLKMIRYDSQKKEVVTEQVSIILGVGFVITFQEREGDVFEPVRQRMRLPGSRFRSLAADYLFYALIDSVVDNYFLVLEAIEEAIEDLEEELLNEPGQELMKTVHKLKQEMITLRRATRPLRGIINSLLKLESRIVTKSTRIFMRDVYDHIVNVIENMESYQDMITGIQELYFSYMSNKMNEVMKILTIIATIFIPLTFIAGVYGMNFEFMPELKWKFGYIASWVVMLVVAIILVLFFKRKKWL